MMLKKIAVVFLVAGPSTVAAAENKVRGVVDVDQGFHRAMTGNAGGRRPRPDAEGRRALVARDADDEHRELEYYPPVVYPHYDCVSCPENYYDYNPCYDYYYYGAHLPSCKGPEFFVQCGAWGECFESEHLMCMSSKHGYNPLGPNYWCPSANACQHRNLCEDYSCKYNCGGYAPGGCYCDEECTPFGDCCWDFKHVCDDIAQCNSPSRYEDSCDGDCGYDEGCPCQCDFSCQDNEDCCGDYTATACIEDIGTAEAEDPVRGRGGGRGPN